MRRGFLVVLVGAVVVLLGVTAAIAAQAYPWSDHAAPFDFEFGNHIDGHQQSLAKNDMLQGFFYIQFDGSTDEASGLPVAKHGDCAAVGVD